MENRGELAWWKSSRSSGGNCVEVATDGDHVFVRHSKDPDGPVLTFDIDAFRAFVEDVRATGTIG